MERVEHERQMPRSSARATTQMSCHRLATALTFQPRPLSISGEWADGNFVSGKVICQCSRVHSIQASNTSPPVYLPLRRLTVATSTQQLSRVTIVTCDDLPRFFQQPETIPASMTNNCDTNPSLSGGVTRVCQ